MEGKQRTIYHILIVLVGTALFLLSGLAAIRYAELSLQQPAPLGAEVEAHDYDRSLRGSIDRLSRCASSCVFHQITSLGCAYPDFRCMCQKFEALNDPCVADTIKQRQIESCLSGCETYQRWEVPDIILDICAAVDVHVSLPEFMMQDYKQNKLFGRQASSAADKVGTFTYTITAGWATERFTSTVTGSYYDTENVYVPSTTTRLLSTARSSATTTSSVDTSVDNSVDTSVGSSSSRKKKGSSLGSKIAIGVVIPLAVVFGALLIRWCIAKKKKKKQGAGGDAENNSTTPGMPEIDGQSKVNSKTPGMAEVDGQNNQMPPAYHQAETKPYDQSPIAVPPPAVLVSERSQNDTETTAAVNKERAHELNNTPSSNFAAVHSPSELSAPYSQDPATFRHEVSGQTSVRSEMPSSPAQTYSSTIGRKPVSSPASQSTTPAPWERDEYSQYTVYDAPEVVGPDHVRVATGSPSGGQDLKALEEEMARIKAQRERLNQLHALEEREEELRRAIEAKKGTGNAS